MLISQNSHCALILVIELAYNYDSKVIMLEEIASKHHIPLSLLIPVAKQLSTVGMISYNRNDRNEEWIFLRRDPAEIFAIDIVQVFDNEIFNGRFVNETTGKLLPDTLASRLINMERKRYANYLRRNLKKISIRRWCEMLKKHNSYAVYH